MFVTGAILWWTRVLRPRLASGDHEGPTEMSNPA
jgi:hypothetical protein